MKYINTVNIISANRVDIESVEDFSMLCKSRNIKELFVHTCQGNLAEFMKGKASRQAAELSLPMRVPSYKCFSFFFDSVCYQLCMNGFDDLDSQLEAFGAGFVNRSIQDEAKKRGFSSFDSFLAARVNHFNTADEFSAAKKGGFTDGELFRKATEQGFYLYDEYQEAQSSAIETKQEYDYYRSLKEELKEYDAYSSEELVLYLLLTSLPPKKSVSVQKLLEQLKEQRRNLFQDMRPPKWYVKAVNNIKDITHHLSNEKIKKIGVFDTESGVFTRNQCDSLSKDSIVLDGSNIAWNGGSKNKGDKPLLQNIERVILELQNNGFNKIVTFVDASLEYQIADRELFSPMSEKYDFHKVPAGTNADIFIIDYALKNDMYILTNDTFKDHEGKYEHLNGDVIKNIRVPFSIVGDTVLLYEENIQ